MNRKLTPTLGLALIMLLYAWSAEAASEKSAQPQRGNGRYMITITDSYESIKLKIPAGTTPVEVKAQWPIFIKVRIAPSGRILWKDIDSGSEIEICVNPAELDQVVYSEISNREYAFVEAKGHDSVLKEVFRINFQFQNSGSQPAEATIGVGPLDYPERPSNIPVAINVKRVQD